MCKIVVATTMIMLKEKGLIDFNTDINKYLKRFKVENKFGKPITVAHLLTHTAGFDDFYIGKSARSETESMPLGELLQKRLPEQIMPPGEVYSYSNMGMALAALLVEEITGKDFEEYVIENLFLPLGMEKSSFRIKKEFKDEYIRVCLYKWKAN
ncbi:MAG: serine hydrolase [Ignavibacteriales bacterium]|nr:serine hydrolase [Ignavibacteriales bacterium]